MPSAELERLADRGYLKREPPARTEIEGLSAPGSPERERGQTARTCGSRQLAVTIRSMAGSLSQIQGQCPLFHNRSPRFFARLTRRHHEKRQFHQLDQKRTRRTLSLQKERRAGQPRTDG